jgi:hypothetical protein
MNELFDLLHPRPSFLTGAARVLDLGGTLTEFRLRERPAEPQPAADYLALKSDWEAVGNDIRAAIAVVAREVGERQADEKTGRRIRKARRPAHSVGR